MVSSKIKLTSDKKWRFPEPGSGKKCVSLVGMWLVKDGFKEDVKVEDYG